MHRNLTKQFLKAMMLVAFVAGLAGCATEEVGVAQPASGDSSEAGGASIASASSQPIKIASFNIQIFGEAKRAKADVMSVLVQIALKYDVLAIQEVRDDTETTVDFFVDAINQKAGGRYAALSGPRLGRSNSKEQYAFIYNKSRIKYLAGSAYTYSDRGDRFHREPFIARFHANNFSFVLIDVHTDPDDVAAEIGALDDVVQDALGHFPGEQDVITLGDLNASCDAFNPKRHSTPIQGPGYLWLVPDDSDTTLAKKPCAYDRIIIRDAATSEDYIGRWGVERFDREFGLTPQQATAVSDHFPVWAEFHTSADTDGLPGS